MSVRDSLLVWVNATASFPRSNQLGLEDTTERKFAEFRLVHQTLYDEAGLLTLFLKPARVLRSAIVPNFRLHTIGNSICGAQVRCTLAPPIED